MPRLRRSREEEEEDAYIAHLEAKLGYLKGAKRRKGDEADGLDDLLDFANSLDESVFDTAIQPSKTEKVNSLMEEEPRPNVTKGDHPVKPRAQEEQDGIARLTRQLKGLINRMSEQNMSTVLDTVQSIYREYHGQDVTATLTTLITGGISSRAMLLESFIVLHAAFISGVYRLVGFTFAAFLVKNVVLAYERHLEIHESDTPNVIQEQGKECSNLIVLLSELYNFQVISCTLLYDIIKDLLNKSLSEFRVGLLLQITRICGQQLRQDDPSALKDIITLAQSGVATQGDNISSRTKFMIETLTNLKNNKIKKSATQHQGSTAVERMKKVLSGLKGHETLRISLDDLRSAETTGDRWVEGTPLVDRHPELSSQSHRVNVQAVDDTILLKLARKQGMNTDVRRSIFVVLMSSSDYVDACDRLGQLNLSEVQQREIVRVILHCCGNEKSYNPYYTLVCQHLSQTSHSYKVTLQFCLWDFLRDLGETGVGGAELIKSHKGDGGQFGVKNISSSRMKNIAKAYGWWIAKNSCSLIMLKALDFTSLKQPTQKFLIELFTQLFAASQVTSPMLTNAAVKKPLCDRSTIEEIFMKTTKIDNLCLGLIFFLSNTFKVDEGFLKCASTVAKEVLQNGINHTSNI